MRTEDAIRNEAREILGFNEAEQNVQQDCGQKSISKNQTVTGLRNFFTQMFYKKEPGSFSQQKMNSVSIAIYEKKETIKGLLFQL